MSEDEPLTLWMKQLQAGDRGSAQELWSVYYDKLVHLAKQRLSGRGRLVGDEEDVALSAFNSFCRGVEGGRFPKLEDRDDLWKILVSITLNKALRLLRNEMRQKRGGNWNRLENSDNQQLDLLQQLAGAEPTADLAVQMAEQLERLMSQLDSPELIELATLKMEGFTNAEIAEKWKKAERTVERKLAIIRQIWTQSPSD